MSVDTLSLFISHLSLSNYASATIRTYVSAVSHIHKLLGPDNPAAHFTIRKLLDAVDKLNPASKPKLQAITISLLHQIIDHLPLLVTTPYDLALYRSVFFSLFYLCARVGELTLSHNNTINVIQLHDLSVLTESDRTVSSIIFSFSKFKHNQSSAAHRVHLCAAPGQYCPLKALNGYLALRGTRPGPVFVSPTGATIKATQVTAILDSALLGLGLSPSSFGSHSFRIGRCTHLASRGASDAQLRMMGRWHSNAFLKYIRPNEVKL